MGTRAIEFVRKSISNQRKAMEKFDRVYTYTDQTNAMLANQHAKAAETLEMWEDILELILDGESWRKHG